MAEVPNNEHASTPPRGALEQSGDSIGPYRLISPIGEGGFGTVWLAERLAPFTQRVAIKILKAGLDSGAVVARFEQERQSLAVMNHPGIAKVLDGGMTRSGRPYFVMELVEGEPITRFCDARRLGIDERLALFARVCDAVQHAHLKGVVHRDLKPSNILAFESDGVIAPKVIDFGVAKAIASDGGANTGVTEWGQMVGTPEYMSPEQADPSVSDIDTRSDVHALGAVLFELLAGAPPFGACDAETQSRARVLRALREKEVPRPGAALRVRGASEAHAIAAVRGAELRRLVARLDGELAWIPLKAMRKEPDQRYQSAALLGDDVRNYLAGRPLVAGPASLAYRARKYAQRSPLRALGAVAVPVIGLATLGAIAQPLYRVYRDHQRALALARFSVLAQDPDPAVVTDPAVRERIMATGRPWRIRHDDTGIVMLLCPPGEFMTGAPESEPGWNEKSRLQHREIERAFYLGEREVSQEEWLRLMPENPSTFYGDPSLPVDSISWVDSSAFCAASCGFFRLPSELEWEYACRAGTTTAFFFGDNIETDQVNYDGFYPYDGAPKGESRLIPVACGSLPANSWGFHEMHGNLFEWCEDRYIETAWGIKGPQPTDELRAWRAMRGGSWDRPASASRSAVRYARAPRRTDFNQGFRVARSAE